MHAGSGLSLPEKGPTAGERLSRSSPKAREPARSLRVQQHSKRTSRQSGALLGPLAPSSQGQRWEVPIVGNPSEPEADPPT
jgi:hypothetical protein